MKTDLLIPMEGRVLYKEESINYKILKGFMISAFMILITLSALRYESRIQELDARLAILEVESIRHEFKVDNDKIRNKREANHNGIPPWVRRTGEGDPEINSEYLEFMRTQSQQTQTRSNSRRSHVRQDPSLVRNDEDETYSVGAFVKPSGLREIHERLPPRVDEVGYRSPPINYDLQTRSAPAAGPRVNIPPPQQVGSGRDQVSARVIRFNDDDDDKETNNAVAAHFVADVSNFTSTDNPRLRNSNGIFQIWQPADWMTGEHFTLDKIDGAVTVKTPGVYHIYAQIHYHDPQQVNSFTVEINNLPLVQCTTTQEGNSCFTAGLKRLKRHDRILIRNVGVDRFSIYKPEKSFFGLMKIGN